MYASELAVILLLGMHTGVACVGCRTCATKVSKADTSPDAQRIRSIQVPPSIAAHSSNPELSGVAWSSLWKRYVVVSDDTGSQEEGTTHAPEVFTLTEDGIMDPEPTPIAGVEKLNDPESICPGPAGSFFITTSHSRNKKGHTPSSRRILVQVEPRGKQLNIVGSLDLTQVQSAAGSGLLAAAGLAPDGALDIEALAFRDRQLFIGLKSPLNAAGEATILKLADAENVVRSGNVPVGAIQTWRVVPLCVQAPTGRVCEGISNMTFLHDGSLVLLGTAPKGGPTDGGGALWYLADPAVPTKLPRLIRHFEGLKPEGVTLSNDGGSIVIVFDRDRLEPAWMKWPIPI
jgi:hypothetical protein